ncbi:TonB-dependent receptor [Salinibacter altiplanensis]|uniref:TonB-dependent receptor n=1 Tax=Salinibacter altiplanensis TaxID=1803181 RepID=UPI000C9FEAAF|nr:TonB-dependent receptor [Salinibacter altiplanensis]
MCLRFIGGLAVVLALIPAVASAQPTVVKGRVQDAQNAVGVPYANVQLKGTTIGTAAGEDGRFRLDTKRTGSVVLRVSAVGYDPVERSLHLQAEDTTTVRLVLRAESVELDGAVVTGKAFSTGSPAESTLGSTEAVTTPGAAGDLFRALQSLPGVAAPGDGAGLFVRGGDVSETKTLLDQATVHRPYRYESPAGGSFGAVRPFLVDGTTLATGGFSAQYGNALSGVLAMESKDRPQESSRYVNLGLAAASVSLDQPLVEDKFGLRLSGNRSFTGLLFRVNGQRRDYATVPQGLDGSLGLTWDYGPAGQLKLFVFARHNRIGVETTEGTYSGVYRGETTNQLYNLQWTTRARGWTVESSASWNAYTSATTLGALDLSPTDQAAKLRVDATRRADDWTLRTGGTFERRRYRFDGTVPTQPDVVAPSAATRSIDELVPATRVGGYTEIEANVLSSLVARAGLRTDIHGRAGRPVVDPRVSLSWQITPHTQLRAAWGLYHQFPELSTYSEHAGENTLGAQRAQHVVVGLRHEQENLLLRAEAYHKPYRDLVVRTGPSRYATDGTGVARGVDLFAKYGSFLGTRFNGWATYSLLRSHRTQPRDQGTEELALENGPAPFDLTHQATVVGKVRIVDQIRIGGTYRYTTGQPFTPVVETNRSPTGALLPVDGPVGSERLPAYHRLDLQVSYFWPFNRQQNVVVYAALNNVLDRANAVDVTYTPDYAERRYRTTNFRRSVYFGLTLTL